jgi:hypothetical protein
MAGPNIIHAVDIDIALSVVFAEINLDQCPLTGVSQTIVRLQINLNPSANSS